MPLSHLELNTTEWITIHIIPCYHTRYCDFLGVSAFSGLEYWNGLLEWSTGVEYWTAVLDWRAGDHDE
jgi:hypothetical protein